MRRDPILAFGVLATGLAIAVAAQAAVPVAFPLFDGVVVAEPYRYLAPPPGGVGSPTSAASTVAIEAGVNPSFAVYTGETPPQAELLAHGGELALGAGSTSLSVTIDPIAPPVGETGVEIVGNVYRFTVTDQSGAALALAPGQSITLALRGPAGISADATIARFANGAWQALRTEPSGLQDFFIANADQFGDFAMLGTIPATPTGINPGLLIAALVAAGLIALLGLRLGRRSGPRTRATAKGRRRPRAGRKRGYP